MDFKKLKKTVIEVICPKDTEVEFRKLDKDIGGGDTLMFRPNEIVSVVILRDTICFNIILNGLLDKLNEDELKEEIKKMEKNILEHQIRDPEEVDYEDIETETMNTENKIAVVLRSLEEKTNRKIKSFEMCNRDFVYKGKETDGMKPMIELEMAAKNSVKEKEDKPQEKDNDKDNKKKAPTN